MTLAFDTSILIAIERNEKEVIARVGELSKINKVPAQIPFISYYEFLKGLMIWKPKRYADLVDFLNSFTVLDTTKTTAKILAELKIKYDKLGVSLSLADLLIASQTIENNLVLVTRDNDFNKIDEVEKIII